MSGGSPEHTAATPTTPGNPLRAITSSATGNLMRSVILIPRLIALRRIP
jgi:hypothetical protein